MLGYHTRRIALKQSHIGLLFLNLHHHYTDWRIWIMWYVQVKIELSIIHSDNCAVIGGFKSQLDQFSDIYPKNSIYAHLSICNWHESHATLTYTRRIRQWFCYRNKNSWYFFVTRSWAGKKRKKARSSGRIVTDALHKSGFTEQCQWIHLGWDGFCTKLTQPNQSSLI